MESIIVANVVVLEESPCPRGSPRTNFQVLVLVLGAQVLSLSLSYSRSGGGACHRPNRLQKVQDASRVGGVQVAGGGRSTCLRVLVLVLGSLSPRNFRGLSISYLCQHFVLG